VSEYHVQELIPAYALDCLEEDERQIVWEHLKSCKQCAAELEDYRQVVEEFPLAVALSSPPHGLKSRLMEQVREDNISSEIAKPDEPSFLNKLIAMFSSLTPVWGAVGLAIILLLGVGYLVQLQRNTQLQNALNEPFRTIKMRGTENSPSAIGLIVISDDGEHGTIVVDQMEILDESREYQLWLIKDGERVSGGVFSVGEDGYGAKWVSAPEPLASYEAFGVTIEPAGGSPGPTGDRVLAGSLSNQ
jgi:anti-sigma-K factor RskA